MNLCFVIPVYRHGSTVESVVQSLLKYNYPIIVVDDGNDEINRVRINEVAEKYPDVITLVTRSKNGGKGKAMTDGILKASEMGITHVFQIDSDGQHDAERAGVFIEQSKKHPKAIICGFPEYERFAPKNRVNGRKFANGWIHFVTMSKDIKDAMIGFRIYPVEQYLRVLRKSLYIDSRMGCDIDILVRMHWLGVPVISESVKVSYPKDGISNYRYVRDTLRISGTYARLCIGMILRLPHLVARKIKKSLKR